MLSKVRETIRRHELFREGDTVVVAVSGGADSIALLHLLRSLEEYRLALVVAHFNHLLRGAESDGDEEFVTALAREFGFPCAVKRFDVREYARQQGLSLEEAGRLCRYAFFDEVAAKYGAAVVALAHHADDQAETVLIRLLRGSAATGLCAMAPKSADGRYVRPFLGVTRHQIEAYLAGGGLSFRTDSSNSDTSFLRNRVRHELLPYLETYNPSVRERLTATADALAADEAVLDALSGSIFDGMADVREGRAIMSAEKIRGEQQGVRLRMYRCALQAVKGNLRRIGRRHLDDIDRLVFDIKPHMALVLPDGIAVGKSYDTVSVYTANETVDMPIDECIITGPGRYGWNSYVVTVGVESFDARTANGPGHACFDGDLAPFPWVVRSFRNGDRFVPFGMTGRKKVKDFFIDQKVPREMRCRIPLVFCQENLLWVGGLRRSAVAPVTARTAAVITVDIELLQP